MNNDNDMGMSRQANIESKMAKAVLEQANDVLNEELVFSERQIKEKPFDWAGAGVFVVFLATFCTLAMLNRNTDAYFLASSVRSIVGVEDKFMHIETTAEYSEWLEYHLFSGLGNMSYRLPTNDSIKTVMVGSLRMRQIRAGSTCDLPGEMNGYGHKRGLSVTCLKADEENGGWVAEPTASNLQFKYMTAEETGEAVYSGMHGWQYSGAGYVFMNTSAMLARNHSKFFEGTEFYQYAHSRPAADDLFAAGWISSKTRAIMHDFTIYSAPAHLYVNVRLVIEIGVDHGVLIPTKHVRLMPLRGLSTKQTPTFALLLEITFSIMVVAMSALEFSELLQQCRRAKSFLQEALIEQKFRLRLKILEYAAFKGLFPYRPRVLMMQISKRVAMASNSAPEHIQRLNAIGRQVPEVHRKWRDFMKTNRAKSNVYDAEEQANALLDLAEHIESIREMQELSEWMSDSKSGSSQNTSPCRGLWKSFNVKVRYGAREYIRDTWNLLDCFNYFLFLSYILLRVAMISGINEAVAKIEATATFLDPWESREDGMNYINIYRLSFFNQIGTYINAFNSVFVWIKVFKYVNVFPSMRILTATLRVAFAPLAMFSMVMVVVLVGSGQGFFLAFGLDIWNFRNMPNSVLALLRMAVGDFDYVGLENSHYVLGPAMFWFYIFLMLFVLMSMFIALIAESYDKAKRDLEVEQDQRRTRSVASDDISSVLRTQARTQVAIKRLAEQNLISWPLQVEMTARLEEKYTPTYSEREVEEILNGNTFWSSCSKSSRLSRRAAKIAQSGGDNVQAQIHCAANQLGPANRRRDAPVDIFSDNSDAEEEMEQLLSTNPNSKDNVRTTKYVDPGPEGPRFRVTIMEARRIGGVDKIRDAQYHVSCRTGMAAQKTKPASNDDSTGAPKWTHENGTVYFECADGRAPLLLELKLLAESGSSPHTIELVGEALLPIKEPATTSTQAWAALRKQYISGWTVDKWVAIKGAHEDEEDGLIDVDHVSSDSVGIQGEVRIVMAWEPHGSDKSRSAAIGGATGLAQLVLKAKQQYQQLKVKEAQRGAGAVDVSQRLAHLEKSFDSHKCDVRDKLDNIADIARKMFSLVSQGQELPIDATKMRSTFEDDISLGDDEIRTASVVDDVPGRRRRNKPGGGAQP